VVFGVKLRGLSGVMRCVMMMAVGDMSMMGGEMVIACLMMPGCLTMMARGVLMVLGCFEVVLCCLFRHGCIPCGEILRAGRRTAWTAKVTGS